MRLKNIFFPELFVYLLILTLPLTAFGQTAGVDAGSIRRQEEISDPDRLNRPPPEPSAGVSLRLPESGTEVVPDGGPTIFLRQWNFSGNTVLNDDALRTVLANNTGRNLTFSEVYAAAAVIEKHYFDLGYLVQAKLPAQEVVKGSVRIEVTEARFAGVQFDGSAPKRVKPEQIERVFKYSLPDGSLVRPDQFDRPFLLANDIPGVTISGAFAPGQKPGETVLAITTVDEDPFTFRSSIDNIGSRATGEERANLVFQAISPLRLGDLLRADVSKSNGSFSGNLQYSLPLGSRGLRAGVSLQHLDYRVVSSELRPLGIEGNSSSYGVNLSYPILRTRDVNLSFVGSHELAKFENSVGGTQTADYDVRQTTVGLNGYWFDDFGKGGASSFGVSLTRGKSDGTNASGAFSDNFNVLRFNLSRQQALSDSTSLFGSLSAQKGPKGLDSAVGFSLGGVNGVRAYPSGEGSGPTGVVLQMELRHRLSKDLSVMGFYDAGRIHDRTSVGEPASYNLHGLGVSMNWQAPGGFTVDLTWARRLGNNPNPVIDLSRPASIQNNDQDGSFKQNRIWLTINKSF